MATVIYINQNCIKILDGHQTQENYYVKDYKKIMMKYNENDKEQYVQELIHILNQLDIDSATLVLHTRNISWKIGEIPQMKSIYLAREVIKKELEDITDAQKEYVCDFRLMKKQDKAGIRVLMFAVEKEKIEFYVNIFKQTRVKLTKIDVTLNSIIKIYEHVFCRHHQTMAIISIENKDVNTFLFIDGKFRYYGKDSMFNDYDSLTLRNELINKVSQVIQFQRGNFRDSTLEDIIVVGLPEEDFSVLQISIKNLFQIDVKNIDYYDLLDKRSQKIDINEGIVNLGALKEWS